MRVRIVQSTATPDQAADAATFSAATNHFHVGARSDIGRRRGNNEDNYRVMPEIGLFVLSDGMGGEAAGEMASKIAVEEIGRQMTAALRRNTPGASETNPAETNPQFGAVTNHLGGAVRRSNRAIWEASQHHAGQRGMGATVVAAVLQPPVMSIAHVGDSRIYLLREGTLQQLTQDHSLVMEQMRRGLVTPEEAAVSLNKNIIVRALGAADAVEVDMDEVMAMPGDHFILCSDGLTNMVRDDSIAQVVGESDSPQHACDRLVEIANSNGGDDNVTVIVVRVEEPRPQGLWGWLKNIFA